MQRQRSGQTERSVVAGVDEAGRGPLAGPVTAAAVVLAPGQATGRLVDSKQLNARQRESVAAEIRSESLAWAVAWADRAEIDALNILEATMLAMRRALLGLAATPTRVLIDGNRLPDLGILRRHVDAVAITGGDATEPAIGAASILAKTARDSMMIEMDLLFPEYAFARHKGYCTAMHRDRLREHGPCALHRRSFAPVRDAT